MCNYSFAGCIAISTTEDLHNLGFNHINQPSKLTRILRTQHEVQHYGPITQLLHAYNGLGCYIQPPPLKADAYGSSLDTQQKLGTTHWYTSPQVHVARVDVLNMICNLTTYAADVENHPWYTSPRAHAARVDALNTPISTPLHGHMKLWLMF